MSRRKGSCRSAKLWTSSTSLLEAVLTQHPTNVNSLQSIRDQRRIGLAVEAVAQDRGDIQQVKKAIEEYSRTPILHQKDGSDSNFTVYDETKIVLNSLGNIYMKTCCAFTSGTILRRWATKRKEGNPYDPLKLEPTYDSARGDRQVTKTATTVSRRKKRSRSHRPAHEGNRQALPR